VGAPAPVGGARRISPFPVVRVAGRLAGRSTRVRLLSVRGPRGATVRVRCRGASCRLHHLRRTIPRSRTLRLRQFERTMRRGTVLEITVTHGARIGKFTRLRFVSGAPPKRTDTCVAPRTGRRATCAALGA
jgi:hypothetical protein